MLKKTHDLSTGLGRLARLTDDLKFVPKNEFDLESWDCGTTACAVGWACRMEWAQDLGLHLREEFYPQYNNFSGMVAAAAFFRLAFKEAEELFCPLTAAQNGRSCTNIDTQISYMQDFLKKKGYY